MMFYKRYFSIMAIMVSYLFVMGCAAHIPQESVQLSQMVGKGIADQNRAYINLLNEYFSVKKKVIDDFVLSTFTPGVMYRIRTKMKAEGVSEIPDTVSQKIIKIIIGKRDSMQFSLEQCRISLLTNAEENAMLLSNSNAAVTALLNSAVAVDKSTAKALQAVDSLTGIKFDFAGFEKTFDQYLIDVGKGSAQANDLYEKANLISNGGK